jgi:hypothetical protein
MEGEEVNWTHLAQDIMKRRTLVKKVMNLRFIKMWGVFLLRKYCRVSRRTPLQGVSY